MAEPGLVISHLFHRRPGPRLQRLAAGAAVWSLRALPEPDWLAAGRQRMFHWGLGPVLADFQPAFRRQGLDRYLADHPVKLFRFDLGPAAGRHQGLLPLAPPLGPAAIRRRTERGLKFIRRFYQGPLAAENYNFYPTGLYGHITEPAFIRAYLEEFDLGLALDLAHGAVTAYNLGLEPLDYLTALPLERVAEIHLSRPWLPADRRQGLQAVDSHQAPGPREWQWLENILQNSRLPKPVPVFVEYYRDLYKLELAQAELAARLRPQEDLPPREIIASESN
jgi:hypothetical protein